MRHKKATETKRRLIMKAMEQAGLKTFRSKVGTLTVSPGGQSVIVMDKTLIPDKYLNPQAPKLDKTQLGKDLRAGLNVTGATLSNSPSKLTIRRN